jgi:hypothetical protein
MRLVVNTNVLVRHRSGDDLLFARRSGGDAGGITNDSGKIMPGD